MYYEAYVAALSAPKAPAGQLTGRQWLELNFEYDKHGRGYIDRDKGNLHSVQDVLDLYAKQFREAPAPAPLGKEFLEWIEQLTAAAENVVEIHAEKHPTSCVKRLAEVLAARHMGSGEAKG